MCFDSWVGMSLSEGNWVEETRTIDKQARRNFIGLGNGLLYGWWWGVFYREWSIKSKTVFCEGRRRVQVRTTSSNFNQIFHKLK